MPAARAPVMNSFELSVNKHTLLIGTHRLDAREHLIALLIASHTKT
jgi:hypothetical protein